MKPVTCSGVIACLAPRTRLRSPWERLPIVIQHWRHVIGTPKKGNNATRVDLRHSGLREIARRLAKLGRVKVEKGEALNVRRRESVRRALIEAGETLEWDVVVAHESDPVDAAVGDVKKMVRNGADQLKRGVASELKEKRVEVRRLEATVRKIEKLADSSKTQYPVEITYTRSAKNATGYKTKTETLTLESAKDAANAARKMEKSLGRWDRLRGQMVEDLKERQESLALLKRNVTTIVESWRGLIREVLVTMP